MRDAGSKTAKSKAGRRDQKDVSKEGRRWVMLAPAGNLAGCVSCFRYVQLAVCGFQNKENRQGSHQDGYVRCEKQISRRLSHTLP